MGNHGPEPPETARALAAGARRSREAQDPGTRGPSPAPVPSPVAPAAAAPPSALAPDPTARPAPVAPAPELLAGLVPAAFWETPPGRFLVRHKWKFIGLLLILLTDLLLLTLGRAIARGPQ